MVVIVREDFIESAKNGCFSDITLEEDDARVKNMPFVMLNENLDQEYKIVVHHNYVCTFLLFTYNFIEV